MSDQKEDHGHHAITREAVRQFFASGRADADGRIDGMNEMEYFHALDNAQRNQDVVTPGTGEGVPTYGTSVPAAWDGDAQRQHGMADPKHDGAYNLDADRSYVENEMAIAHEGGGRDEEMKHLGNATHALEDSYSEAHAFRGESVNSGDPNAPVESFNVWDPTPHHDAEGNWHWGKLHGDEQGTHDERFDAVPVEGNPSLEQSFDGPVPLVHGSDQAAAAATAQMLETYHDHRQDSMATAVAANHETVGQFYQPPADGQPGVNRSEGDPAWIAERDRRLREHEAEEAAAGVGADGEPNQSRDPGTAAEPNASYQLPEPNASYQPPAESSSQSSEPNASYQPPEPNASYQPPEPNASYQPPVESSSQSSEPNQSTEPNASTDPAQSSSE
jgi:hypothetical protein